MRREPDTPEPYDPEPFETGSDDTDPDGVVLVSSPAAAALDGPVPEPGPVPTPFIEGETARVRIDPALMPEVEQVVNAERHAERAAALGAMVDAMILHGTDPHLALVIMRSAIDLLETRRKDATDRALRKTLPGPPAAVARGYVARPRIAPLISRTK